MPGPPSRAAPSACLKSRSSPAIFLPAPQVAFRHLSRFPEKVTKWVPGAGGFDDNLRACPTLPFPYWTRQRQFAGFSKGSPLRLTPSSSTKIVWTAPPEVRVEVARRMGA